MPLLQPIIEEQNQNQSLPSGSYFPEFGVSYLYSGIRPDPLQFRLRFVDSALGLCIQQFDSVFSMITRVYT